MEILINKEIGGYTFAGEEGITVQQIKNELQKVKESEQVSIIIDSLGGDCFEGIAIYNEIRDFARNHKQAINTYIKGSACSVASWLALAANSVNKNNKVIVEDNSIFMVHNCWGFAVGDYREMEKQADLSKRIDSLICQMLAKRGSKNENQIKQMMDNETWLFGKEIYSQGFADEIIEDENKQKNEAQSVLVDLTKKKFANLKINLGCQALTDEKPFKKSLENSIQYFKAIDKTDEQRLLQEQKNNEIKRNNEQRLTKAKKIYSDCMSK
ncbi:head maturation protease, ClpP-related [Treponema pectinovorum]|uniref:head maturation protease, ClpP-related n=1 Tax=Treponema pectinovorum TaxID=164 RepID=UPI00164E4D10|nr:head maturation protease, ClpP-related [Treponema pectinovorum]